MYAAGGEAYIMSIINIKGNTADITPDGHETPLKVKMIQEDKFQLTVQFDPFDDASKREVLLSWVQIMTLLLEENVDTDQCIKDGVCRIEIYRESAKMVRITFTPYDHRHVCTSVSELQFVLQFICNANSISCAIGDTK